MSHFVVQISVWEEEGKYEGFGLICEQLQCHCSETRVRD